MGQISACKDVAYEVALTVKLPGVHGNFHGWSTKKRLHNTSVTESYFGKRSSCRNTIPVFMWIHLPQDTKKAQKQKPVIFASRDPSWLRVACQVYSLLLDPHGLHPFLTAQQWTAIMGPPLFYISIFVATAPPGWLKGDETPSVSVSPLLMDSTKDAGSSFEEQDMGNTFQTQEPECHPPGGGDNSQSENFQDALSLRGCQSRISRNTSHTV